MDKILELNFKEFKKQITKEIKDIDEGELTFIYQLIHNNCYALMDSHYSNVLSNYIREKTSNDTSLKVMNFISHYDPLLN